jgi:hypothetical protein
MKTRIISEEKCGRIVYKVQYKFLFWWFTESMSDIGWHGEIYGSYDLTFDSIKKAEDYICKNYSKPIIKVIQ